MLVTVPTNTNTHHTHHIMPITLCPQGHGTHALRFTHTSPTSGAIPSENQQQ